MALINKLTAIADAIRAKTGKEDTLTLDTMVTEIANIETGVDTSDATAAVNDILSGKTAYVNGEKITGTIPSKAATTITPSLSTQTAISAGTYASGNITVAAMPTATQATPTISIDSAGKITSTSTQTAGYVAAGTKSATKQLTVQAAKTITPTNSSQTAVASGRYTTGAITVSAIPSSYTQLNFTVVGGTSAPSNPSANTIWVNTNTSITSWVFSATQPTGSAGMVWISTGTTSPTKFNALKQNNITVYPLSVKQYISEAWVSKTVKSYQNNAWVDWLPEGALYYYGDTCDDKTGGWQQTGWDGWVDISTQSGTISANSMNISITTNNHNYGGLAFITKNSITRGSYTKLCFSLSNYSKTAGTFNIYCGASSVASNPNISGHLKAVSTPTSNGTCTVDISGLPSTYAFYPVCGVAEQSGGKGTVTFEKVWLE